jgi:hypothetical protein
MKIRARCALLSPSRFAACASRSNCSLVNHIDVRRITMPSKNGYAARAYTAPYLWLRKSCFAGNVKQGTLGRKKCDGDSGRSMRQPSQPNQAAKNCRRYSNDEYQRGGDLSGYATTQELGASERFMRPLTKTAAPTPSPQYIEVRVIRISHHDNATWPRPVSRSV